MVRAFAAALVLFLMLANGSHSLARTRGGAIDTQSSKYAALVMDADSGEIFYSRAADAKRYPASLTKMMTLYLTFEALSQGKVTMSTALDVSENASMQPQTNIGLEEGETIRVGDAIRAVVVHSANDAAMVLAEGLGQSMSGFAARMTKKAHELGMTHTVFRNPNGLPDVNQYTTARDMAKLGIALRKDFPQYYNFFKTHEFAWHGRTYTSHNRVFGRFPGVDGIKTGYIQMSGFNLVTSVSHNGYHVVAVVMGGQSGASRDNHMVSLLEKTFGVLADRGDRPRGYANVKSNQLNKNEDVSEIADDNESEDSTPNPRDKAKEEAEAERTIKLSADNEVKSDAPVVLALNKAAITPKDKPADIPSPSKLNASKSTDAKEKSSDVKEKPIVIASIDTKASVQEHLEKKNSIPNAAPFEVKPSTSPFQLVSKPAGNSPMPGEWGIQVGAFQDEPSAVTAANHAMKVAKDALKDSKLMVTGSGGSQNSSVHRARIANLSEFQAKKACQTLVANNTQCFVFRADRLRDL